MEFSELKIDSFIKNESEILQVKYYCFCGDPKNPKFTFLNESGKIKNMTLSEIKEKGYVRDNSRK